MAIMKIAFRSCFLLLAASSIGLMWNTAPEPANVPAVSAHGYPAKVDMSPLQAAFDR